MKVVMYMIGTILALVSVGLIENGLGTHAAGEGQVIAGIALLIVAAALYAGARMV